MNDITINHQEFILNLYECENIQLKKEIEKFFVIKKNKRLSISPSTLDSSRDLTLDQKINNPTNDISLTNDNSSNNLDLSTHNNFQKGSSLNLIDHEEKNQEKNNLTETDVKVELKYSLFFKYFKLLVFFFRTEYRLINLFIKEFNVITKTNFWTLICFRLFASLSIVAMLTGRGDDENISSTVLIKKYNIIGI